MFYFHSFTQSCPVFPAPLTEKTVFSLLYILAPFLINELTINSSKENTFFFLPAFWYSKCQISSSTVKSNNHCWSKTYLIANKKTETQVVQWLGPRTSTARDMGFIPGWGTKIPYAVWHGQKERKQGLKVTLEANSFEAPTESKAIQLITTPQ